jgi:hypothetical protein
VLPLGFQDKARHWLAGHAAKRSAAEVLPSSARSHARTRAHTHMRTPRTEKHELPSHNSNPEQLWDSNPAPVPLPGVTAPSSPHTSTLQPHSHENPRPWALPSASPALGPTGRAARWGAPPGAQRTCPPAAPSPAPTPPRRSGCLAAPRWQGPLQGGKAREES